jgi:hypothetical protein
MMKKPKPKHRSKTLRESARAEEAKIFNEGFQMGYKLGLKEGERLATTTNLPKLLHDNGTSTTG